MIIKEWIDELDDEYELMCLDWHEYHDKEPYFVDKDEIKRIFKRAESLSDNIKVHKINNNRYVADFNGDILYFVCPYYANNIIKQHWNCLKNLFEKYISD